MFQFSRLPPYTYLIQYTVHGHYSMWVPPFGNLRIEVCLRLPAAYRSLPRPSSATGAKASSLRSFMLNLQQPCGYCVNHCNGHSLAVCPLLSFFELSGIFIFVLTTLAEIVFASALIIFYLVVSLLTAAFSFFISLFSSQGTFSACSRKSFNFLWWAQVESNHRPRAYQARALTI